MPALPPPWGIPVTAFFTVIARARRATSAGVTAELTYPTDGRSEIDVVDHDEALGVPRQPQDVDSGRTGLIDRPGVTRLLHDPTVTQPVRSGQGSNGPPCRSVV